MKNFYQLDTYINVEKLFECINTLIKEKQKEDYKSQSVPQWRSKQKITYNYEDLVDKVKDKLG